MPKWPENEKMAGCMVLSDRKLALWKRLRASPHPVSLSVMVGWSGGDCSDRTLRRWLADLIAQGLIERVGSGRATRYRALDAPSPGRQWFSAASSAIVERIRRPLYDRQPVGYQEAWIEAYQPNQSFYLAPSVRARLHESGARSRDHEPAGTYARHIYNRLLIDLSFNSSRLEGNTYSLLDTQRLLLEGESPEGKLDEERVMILNHKEAIRYLVDNAANVQCTIDAIYSLHYLLSDGLVDPLAAGKIRDHGVRIGGSTYVPHEDAYRLKLQLERACRKAVQIRDPFEQSLFVLVHISYLQAFADVNKRTARLAANIPFIRNNFVPLSFNDVDRNEYVSAMIACYELQEVGPISDLFELSYLRTCELYDATIQTLGFDEVRVRYRSQRRAIIRDIVQHKLVGEEIAAHITLAARDAIPEKDRAGFLEDVEEDLRLLNESRLAGLGLTPAQLREWQRACEGGQPTVERDRADRGRGSR